MSTLTAHSAKLSRWPWFGLVTVLAFLALPLVRLALNLGLGFPAPAGDSVLFASVAQYHCTTGRFETPIFPLDPTGAYRYVWHGIGHPALLSWLNPDCSVRGAYLALSLVLLATSALVMKALVRTRGWWVALSVALVLFALQSKQGFRPETSALLLVLVCEWMRQRGHTLGWALVLGLLPWFQPTTFLLYAVWCVLTTSRTEIMDLWKHSLLLLVLGLAVQLLLLALYPFPVMDLLEGLGLQGKTYAQRTDGSVFTYWIRSDFFPLFGLAFGWVYALCVVRRPALLLLLPVWWFYGFRAPPTYYNLIPAFGVMLLWLWWPGHPSPTRWFPMARRALLGVCVLLAAAGLAQSVARDATSLARHGSTLEAAQAQVAEVRASGRVPCQVPRWLTLLEAAQTFEASGQPLLKACRTARASERVDLVPPQELSQRGDRAQCLPWPQDRLVPVLDSVFSTDSGYGFWLCPTAAP